MAIGEDPIAVRLDVLLRHHLVPMDAALRLDLLRKLAETVDMSIKSACSAGRLSLIRAFSFATAAVVGPEQRS
jgi:hypothetical protein